MRVEEAGDLLKRLLSLGRGSVSFILGVGCASCAALASVSAPAGPNRDDFDPTAEVEGRQHQTVLSMAATMRWVRPRAKGIAR
jgi:hypothetical protein